MDRYRRVFPIVQRTQQQHAFEKADHDAARGSPVDVGVPRLALAITGTAFSAPLHVLTSPDALEHRVARELLP